MTDKTMPMVGPNGKEIPVEKCPIKWLSDEQVAIKELRAEVAKLRADLDALKREVADLRQCLDAAVGYRTGRAPAPTEPAK